MTINIYYVLTSLLFLSLSLYLHYSPVLKSTMRLSATEAEAEALLNELKSNPIDANSFARPDQTRVSHISWNAFVDFDNKLIKGSVDLTVDKQTDASDQLILDSSGLTIEQVKDQETGQPLKYELSPSIKIFGSKLTIKILAKKRSIVTISYKTSPNASGLQWLRPEQTAGKRHAYMFSQCQAIHCRSILPCQDTPAVKASYEAKVVVPKDMVVLLSAVRLDEGKPSKDGSTKEYCFDQKIPVPSYLIAIVVGDIVSKRIGPRSHVWSEPELIEKSANEFVDTENMISTAESIVGPYIWGTYDLLVLPPSFPFGGMENPCLTFVTPTLLAGDRSLVDVVAHEIAHSWTGNLVTNRNWGHFWLNEGFTRFLEEKIVGRLDGGEPQRHFRAMAGLKHLSLEIKAMGADNPYTKLLIDPRGVDPDDAFSSVPYEKGQTFLFYLEQLLGGPSIFEPFLKSYIDHFKFKSIITDDFKRFLYQYFKDKTKVLDQIDWNLWLNSTGMPPIIPDFDLSLSKECSELGERWIAANDNEVSAFTKRDLQSMNAWQVMDFLQKLLDSEPPLSHAKIEAITETYGLKTNNNSEIRSLWIQIGLRSHWKGCVDNAIQFITSMGRMKFLKPIYRYIIYKMSY